MASIIGLDGDDSLLGTPLRDQIRGLGGNDLLEGRGHSLVEVAPFFMQLLFTMFAEDIGVHRTIAYRLLTTLERRTLVQRAADGAYRLGGGLLRLSAAVGDELGLLTWQDFLFACAAYPEEEPLRSEIEAEARDRSNAA